MTNWGEEKKKGKEEEELENVPSSFRKDETKHQNSNRGKENSLENRKRNFPSFLLPPHLHTSLSTPLSAKSLTEMHLRFLLNGKCEEFSSTMGIDTGLHGIPSHACENTPGNGQWDVPCGRGLTHLILRLPPPTTFYHDVTFLC
ncbi:hypothetical protein CEXT_810321 [Caerostris extrusa]|uniref:Uncharacterized protein n=1 Tax=Caerostris extrusa TaxID=172846 RepID=A0AAV4UD79_CAEEX|nr:hypothetical protein CEXT_810321 [Caerostris extrusa]